MLLKQDMVSQVRLLAAFGGTKVTYVYNRTGIAERSPRFLQLGSKSVPPKLPAIVSQRVFEKPVVTDPSRLKRCPRVLTRHYDALHYIVK